jgi:serine/threonine-protein kinase
MAESHPQRQPDDPPPSVLELVAQRTGLAPKISLHDDDSVAISSPVIDPSSKEKTSVPRGRSNYQFLGEIARGGMGVVLKGHDTDLGRDVAVKVLDQRLADRPEVVQRFVEEAQIGGQLQHPGIVPVYELGTMQDERPFFTMKLIKGHTLASLLQQRKSPADNRGRTLAIFESVCQTVAYAHSKGVLHRDLKPANVMVGAFGEVQVVDWGLAKVLRRGGVADERRAKESLHSVIATVRSGPGSSGSDSLVGSVMGTPAYMAPEQAQGEVEKLDERADVFALGAILCEILTGRPPYCEDQPDAVVVQAAHAALDPARARVEACDADPALKRLCLACLMPARAARPANAGEVARTLRDFLVSVEERAHQAELASAEARIKASEERRARRLTLALAIAVVSAMALGGGGAWWASHERAQRADQTRAAVEVAQGESIELAQDGKPAEALVAAQRALSLAETGAGDSALVERARKFAEKAAQDAGAAERERALAAQDEALRTRLVDLRLQQIATIGDAEREKALDAQFTQAFHDYGVDLEGDDLVPALERIRERAIAEDVALALDDWGRLRRSVHGPKSEKAENLFVLAMDLDHDPLRMRMREAIAARDEEAMRALVAPESLPKLGPGSMFVLSAELWGDGSEPRRLPVYRILEQALRQYPGDFVLQAVAGAYFHQGGRFEAALACRQAAVALRPGDHTARVKLGETLYFLGRLAEARATLRAVHADAPEDLEASDLLSLVEVQLGNYAEGLMAFERCRGVEANAGALSDYQVALFLNGRMTREEFASHSEGLLDSGGLLTYLFPLLDHPDPVKRDPEFVLRKLEQLRASMQNRWHPYVEAIARVRLEDWAGAQAILERQYRLPWIMMMTPMAYDFLRALVLARVGRVDEARACYERGMVQWNTETADEPTAWERSDAMRWRREAEAALEK